MIGSDINGMEHSARCLFALFGARVARSERASSLPFLYHGLKSNCAGAAATLAIWVVLAAFAWRYMVIFREVSLK